MNIRISPFHDKRGFEKLFQFVIYLVIVIMILLGLLQFINNYSSGEAVKEQILAKQIALAIVYSLSQRLRAESSEDHVVDCADPCTGKHTDREFGNHGKVDGNSISLLDAFRL